MATIKTRFLGVVVGVVSAICANEAAVLAQVIEPNGIQVPAAPPATEVSLQSYFTAQSEGIDAVKNASVEPGVFQPLCGFQATLVLSQSGGKNGIAWYNVPTSPTAAPLETFLIVPAGTPVGQVINSTDVRNNAKYAQGLIGFALMDAAGTTPIYYSEYRRNVNCTGCSKPDYWKMALIYRSTAMPETYYLGFEDWPGADSSSWQGNDGDFNDKVFRIKGVTCEGGGVPCDTGKPGVCSTGITMCTAGTTPTCKQQIQPGIEVCDNLDNDCNGQVDDGMGLCPTDQVCSHGTCIRSCGNVEFDCVPPYVCQDKLCVEAECVGKTCPTGQVCRTGKCVGGCEGVVCPAGQDCQLGVCLDLCANVTCATGSVCERGVCVGGCACRTCATGKKCAADGRCVESGCESVTCPTGQVCRAGVCGDPCQGVVCPGGAACKSGICDKPDLNAIGGRTGAGGSAVIVRGTGGSNVGTGGLGAGTTGGATGTGGAPGSGGADGSGAAPRVSTGCGCGLGGTIALPTGSLGFVVFGLFWAWSRRRR